MELVISVIFFKYWSKLVERVNWNYPLALYSKLLTVFC